MNESNSQQAGSWEKKISVTEDELREEHGDKFMSRGSDYVCARELERRMAAGNRLSARINGRRGTYSTMVTLEGTEIFAKCDCPSDRRICRHAVALVVTYLREKESFFDLGEVADDLSSNSVDELLDIIIDLAMREPRILGLMGVAGFGSFD